MIYKELPGKKVLSLVLCVAVMLSVMVLGAGAAFSDQDQIENTEAVNMCSALNIIGGYEDGSFHPERNIKRSEVTKMICVALNGGTEPNVSTNAVPTFSDVRGTSAAWAEGYIEACVAQGIVSGVGGGRFSPDGNVTGAQLAKMLLVALGYNADNEKFIGDTWETNVNVRASQKGLYKGLEAMDTSVAVTRDQAAQMVWNALQANMVEYKTTIVTDENGQLTTQVTVQDRVVASTSDKLTLLRDKYDGVVETGFITAAPSSKTNPKGISFAWDKDGDGQYGNNSASVTETVTFRNVTTDVSDLLGYEVTMVWNTNDINAADAIYGFYKTDNNVDYTMTWDEVEQDTTKSNAVKFNNASYDLDGNFACYADDVAISSGVLAPASWNSSNFDGSEKADTVVLIDNNGDGKLDAAQIKEVDVAKVNYVSNTGMTTALVGARTYAPSPYVTSPKLADVNVYEGIAKDDYAKVTYDYYTDKLTYEKLEVQTGTIEATRTTGVSSTKEISIDGTWYKASAEYTLPTTLYTGDSIEFVAVGNLLYHVKKIDGTFGSNSLAIIYAAADYTLGVDTGKVQVSILKRDGTTANVFVDKTYGWNNGAVANAAALTSNFYKIVTYRIVDGEYRFMPISGSNLAGFEQFANDASSKGNYDHSDVEFAEKEIADNAIVFVYDSDTSATTPEVMTGKSFKAVAAGDSDAADTNYLYNDNNGFDEVMVMSVGFDAGIPTVVGSNFGVLTVDAYENVTDEDGYRNFKMYVSGLGEVTAREKNGNNYTYSAGTVLTYEIVSTDENGVLTIKDVEDASDAYTMKLGMVTSNGVFDDKYIGLDSNKYEVDSDTIYIDMNTETNTGVAYGDQAKAALTIADTDNGVCNVRYIVENGKVKFILTDSTNYEIMGSVAVDGGTTDADVVINAFKKANTVVVKGTLVPDANISVTKGKTLIVEDALTLGTHTLDVDGKLVADSIADLNNVATYLTGDGTVLINNQDEVSVAQYKNSVAAQLQLATDVGATAGTAGSPQAVTASVNTGAGATTCDLDTLTATTYNTANATVTAELVTGGNATNVEKVEVSGGKIVLTTDAGHSANGLNTKTVNVKVTVSAPGVADLVAYYQYTITDA